MVTNCLGANWPLQSRSVGQEHPTLLLSSHGLRNEILVVLLGNVTEQAVVREVLPVPLGLRFCFLPFFFFFSLALARSLFGGCQGEEERSPGNVWERGRRSPSHCCLLCRGD